MTLEEAYDRIRLRPLVSFEQGVEAPPHAPPHAGPRRIGSTVHMLVELYLDMIDAFHEVPLWEHHRVKFLVWCYDKRQGRDLRRMLDEIHGSLRQGVDPGCVEFVPHEVHRDRLKGRCEWHSWGVFCDHAVLEHHGLERSVGPYRLVRTLERGPRGWAARDRDGGVVCRLTDAGMRDLVDASPCPITYQPSDQVFPVTYPAWSKSSIKFPIRLTRAFDL